MEARTSLTRIYGTERVLSSSPITAQQPFSSAETRNSSRKPAPLIKKSCPFVTLRESQPTDKTPIFPNFSYSPRKSPFSESASRIFFSSMPNSDILCQYVKKIFFLSYFFGQHEKSSVFKRVFHLFNRVINKVGEKRKKLFRVIFNEFFRLSARKIIFFLKTEYSIIPKNFSVRSRYEIFRTLYIVVEPFRAKRRFSKRRVTNREWTATT